MLKQQHFGVEVEMTGISRRDAAHTLARFLGGRCWHEGGIYDAWKVEDRYGRTWKVMNDASIRPERKVNTRRYDKNGMGKIQTD
jgi:hypothetical protein